MAQNFGKDALRPREDAYDRAEEVLKISLDMWTGWTDGALAVVPILQKRGVFRKEHPGSTLRQTIKS